MDIAIHINPAQPHQVEHGQWLAKGFITHGIKPLVTADIAQPADIHIVSGPWYAKRHWLGHPRVILLDRCYYKGDPDHVSLGWMNDDGGRRFRQGGGGRIGPIVKDKGTGSGSLFLADYHGPIDDADAVRLHPARTKHRIGLLDHIRRHRLAIGYQTTALVTAALEGLQIDCRDSRNIMAQPNWLDLLPYADWHHTEIESGAAWEHLQHDIDRYHSTDRRTG